MSELNMKKNDVLLEVKNLKKYFPIRKGLLGKDVQNVKAVDDISFHIKKGETLGLVGESGCGKSVTAQSTMQLIPMPPGRIKDGSVMFNGKDLTKLTDKQMESVRGSEISMIFQDPMTSLNPTMKVGKQIMEGLV